MFNGMNGLTPSDIAAVTRGNDDGFSGNNGWWILVILFAIFGGWGNNGARNYDAAAMGQRDVLATDFATIERKIDGVNNGLCDGFYSMNTGMLNGFNNLGMSMMQNGYETRNAIAQLSAQNADCCCKTQQNIQQAVTQGVMNTSSIQNNIQNAMFQNEKTAMQSRFDAQAYNCATLQAIEKVGDRVINYMSQAENQRLRDENMWYRFQASQTDQNQYLRDTFMPCAKPAYITCSPYNQQPIAVQIQQPQNAQQGFGCPNQVAFS